MFEHWFNPWRSKPRDHHGEFDRSQAYYVPANYNATVGAATAVIVRGNDRRKRLTFCNSSSNDIWLSKGLTAALNQGIYLAAGGGVCVDEIDAYGYLYRGVWSAIATGAGSNLGICEE